MDKLAIDLFLAAHEMPLNLHEQILRPERFDCCSGRRVACNLLLSCSGSRVGCILSNQRRVKQRDQSLRERWQFVPLDLALSFLAPEMRLSQELAQIFVARSVL